MALGLGLFVFIDLQNHTHDTVQPVNLTHCIDEEWLESTVDSELIPGVKKIFDHTDELLRNYPESQAEKEKDMMKISNIDAIIKKELFIDRSDSSSRSRMERLFTFYVSVLRRNGLTWVMKEYQKQAV